MQVIAFAGKAESGKDTFAKSLKSILEQQNKRVLILHYADLLKFYCKEYFGWNGVKDAAGREILQNIGTDVVRARSPDFWVDAVANFIQVFADDYDYFLIPDCRFPNEFEVLQKRGFKVFSARIERPDHQNNLTPEQRNHPSENSLADYKFDCMVWIKEGFWNVDNVAHEFAEFLGALNF